MRVDGPYRDNDGSKPFLEVEKTVLRLARDAFPCFEVSDEALFPEKCLVRLQEIVGGTLSSFSVRG